MLEEEALTKQDAAREERQEELERTFSYDGYQVVRKELFAHLRDPAIVIRNDSITFNTACITGLENVVYVHVMFNKELKRLVVRGCNENDKDAFKRRTLPHKRVEGETVYHKVWNCRERQKGPKGNGCRNNFIREEELLRKVSDQLGWEWKGADDFDAEQFNALVQAVYVENGEVSVRRLARRVSA